MNEHEKQIVDAFIVKEKRDRYRLFLDYPGKRHIALDGLHHGYDLDERYVTWLPRKAFVEQILRKAGSPEMVYIMSPAEDLDGRVLPLYDAITEVTGAGIGTIISCIPGQLAYYYSEAGLSHAILQRKQNIKR